MTAPRILLAVAACGVFLLMASSHPDSRATVSAQAKVGNPVTGEGFPNPAPKVTRNWGQLPAGRKWGTSAGIDIDPKDGNIWAYERCGAGTAGGGPVDCDNTPLDPIFKFDRHTGAVLANIGKGVMVTPHGIYVDKDGNVWIADFANNKEGTKGQQVHKFSPKGEKLLSLGVAGKAGQCGRSVQPAQRRRHRARRQHLRRRRPRRAGHDDRRRDRRGAEARRDVAHQQVHGGRQVHQVVGHRSA